MKMFRAVRLGQGDIRDRVERHRNYKEITKYKGYGSMYVTWAVIPKTPETLVTRVESYLADQYKPLVGQYPDGPHEIVNLPWEAT